MVQQDAIGARPHAHALAARDPRPAAKSHWPHTNSFILYRGAAPQRADRSVQSNWGEWMEAAGPAAEQMETTGWLRRKWNPPKGICGAGRGEARSWEGDERRRRA